MVGKKLEGNDGQETLETVDSAWDTDGLHAGLDVLVIVVANDNGLALSRCDLHERGLNLGVERVLGHDENDGHGLVNEGKGTVLEFTGKDTLRVHIADLLDLEGTLETGRVLVTSAHDEQRALLSERVVSKCLQSLVLGKDGLDLVWEGVQAVDDGVSSLSHRDSVLAKLDGHHDEGNVLGCVSLGGGDTDFGTGVDVDTTVGLSGHGGADGVDDTETEGTSLQAVSEREDGVSGLTGLRDENADIITENGSLAVQKVRSELDGDGNLGQLFENGTGGQA